MQTRPFPTNPAAPVVSYALIATCVAVFFLLQGEGLVRNGALWPPGGGFEPWQVLTYAFLHGDPTHLVFNMLGLYMFGADIERVVGHVRFAVLFFAGVLAAAAAQLFVVTAMQSPYPTVGASGGLFGLMLVFALLFPKAKIVPLIPPIPMPAPVFVALYAGIELWLGVTGTQQGVAHFAHLGGLVGGAIVWAVWRAQFKARHGR